MILTPAQKTTLKTHVAANTNTTPATDSNGQPLPTPFVINAEYQSGDAEKERAIAEWYNAVVTGTENQPFATPNELWVPDAPIKLLNSAIDWTTLIPHGLAGGSTTTEQYLSRIYKLTAWQSMHWDGRLDFTDTQQRGGIIGIFGSTTATTTALAAVGVGRKVPRRIERVFAGSAVGQAGIGGTIGRVCPAGIYGGTINAEELHDAIING